MLPTIQTHPKVHPLTPQILLGHLTQQSLTEADLTADFLFLAATITLLSGVMEIDGSIEPEETDHLHTVINACVDPKSPLYALVQDLVSGVCTHQVYLNPQQFLSLADTLDDSARLLLLGLGYNMAMVDGHFNLREQLYLRGIAHRLQILPRHQYVLEAIATQQPIHDTETLLDLFLLLHPDRFQGKAILRTIARTIHSNLPEPALT